MVFFVLSIIACATMRNDQTKEESSLYDDLVGLLVQESFVQGEECLNVQSISFEFKFPESINRGTTNLSSKEKDLIMTGLNSPPIDWNNVLKTRYRSINSSNCLHISKPVFFRNDKLAFVYKAQLKSEFYNIYEKVESGWKFKESIITLLN